MERSDAQLVQAALDGDRDALGAMYDRYAERLHAFCVGMLHDRHEAADATHDTFLLAGRRLAQLRDPDRLRPWLYAIARNECLRRSRQRARLVPTEDVGDVAGPDRHDGDAGIDAGMGAEEAAALLWAAADGLDERDRVLLELHLRHGLEGAELADAAGIRAGQISMAVGRMKERVERSLGALLVARQANPDCAGLRAVLAGWDGTFTVLMRKRVARHVDDCAECQARRSSLVGGFAALGALPFVPLPVGLRDRVLESLAAVFDGGGPTHPTDTEPDWAEPASGLGEPIGVVGFPPPPSREWENPEGPPALPPRRFSRALGVALILIVLLVSAYSAWDRSQDEAKQSVATQPVRDPGEEPDPVGTTDPGATTTRPGSTTTRPTSTTVPGASSTTVPTDEPDGPGGPTATTAPPPVGGPTTAPTPGSIAGPPATAAPTTAPPPTTAPNAPPGVSALALSSPGPLRPSGCPATPQTAQASATVTDDRGVASVVLVFTQEGGPSGTRPMALSGGKWRATLGPFAFGGTVTWRVRATDADGSVTTSSPRSVGVDPCPG